MNFKVSQDCNYVNGYLRYGHFEGIVEAENEEELKKIIKESPENIKDYMSFELDDYEINDYDTKGNPIIIEGVIGE